MSRGAKSGRWTDWSEGWSLHGNSAGPGRKASGKIGGKGRQKGGSQKGGSSDSAGQGKGGDGAGGQKPTDDPHFVVWSEGMRFNGSRLGVSYVVEAYVASGTFSRVFRVRAVPTGSEESPEEAANSSAAASQEKGAGGTRRRWAQKSATAAESGAAPMEVESSLLGCYPLAAKVMRRTDAYIQYSSDAQKEGNLLQKIEAAQQGSGKEVLTMRCFDSFATSDDAGNDYWCLILEWLDASLFDLVRVNGNRGLHLSMVRVMLSQLLEQLHVLQRHSCTHTDIKHKNCCLLDTEHFMAPVGPDQRQTIILTRPLAKFIDYGNAVFEGDKKTHPIHTKQFRAPEVLLNVAEGWGPPSDTWTLGVTAAFLVSGQLLFNSHDPGVLLRTMVRALGPFPTSFLETARDGRMRRVAEESSRDAASPTLGEMLGLKGADEKSPEASCIDLLRRMLALAPAERISAAEALKHPFIASGQPPVPSKPAGAELKSLRGAQSQASSTGKGGRKGK